MTFILMGHLSLQHFKNTYSPITLANISSINLIFNIRCSNSPCNPVYPRSVGFSVLVLKMLTELEGYTTDLTFYLPSLVFTLSVLIKTNTVWTCVYHDEGCCVQDIGTHTRWLSTKQSTLKLRVSLHTNQRTHRWQVLCPSVINDVVCVIHTLPQYQVCVCVNEFLNYLLIDPIPPLSWEWIHPSIDQKFSHTDVEHMTPETLYVNQTSSWNTDSPVNEWVLIVT
jgi:hypothetical protein